MPLRPIALVASLCGCLAVTAAAAEPRVFYDAPFEPEHGVIHGGGQMSMFHPDDAFADIQGYHTAVGDARRPRILMGYANANYGNAFGMDGLGQAVDTLEAQGHYVIPQIGISLPSDGQLEQYKLDDLADAVRSFDRPAYLRIGYEFNGFWNAYQPTQYKQNFRQITDTMRRRGVPAATVWTMYPIEDYNQVEAYYPGDDYVDWFGVDMFFPGDFTQLKNTDFFDEARARQKPVMIGEATPATVGADDASDWNAWFEDYFQFIENTPEVKAHAYINWDWAEWAVLGNNHSWSNWGDARLESPHGDPTVRQKYRDALDDELFLHAGDSAPAWATFDPGRNLVAEDFSQPRDPSLSPDEQPRLRNYETGEGLIAQWGDADDQATTATLEIDFDNNLTYSGGGYAITQNATGRIRGTFDSYRAIHAATEPGTGGEGQDVWFSLLVEPDSPEARGGLALNYQGSTAFGPGAGQDGVAIYTIGDDMVVRIDGVSQSFAGLALNQTSLLLGRLVFDTNDGTVDLSLWIDPQDIAKLELDPTDLAAAQDAVHLNGIDFGTRLWTVGLISFDAADDGSGAWLDALRVSDGPNGLFDVTGVPEPGSATVVAMLILAAYGRRPAVWSRHHLQGTP